MDLRVACNTPISGSYAPEDCLFLLKPITPPDIPVAEKERLIQSGQKHYSEMLSHEQPPSAAYTELFLQQVAAPQRRLAQDVLNLAAAIRRHRAGPVTLVSLARAGTPIGALLQRALRRDPEADSRHYSISIIRDRGIDENALRYILHHERRPPESVVFIDGWTAKGVITRELKNAVARWNRSQPETLSDALYVIADIGGSSDVAASYDDYLIPSGILGAAVSGLVSRSILNEQIGPGDFHGCFIYRTLKKQDYSAWFLDTVSAAMAGLSPQPLPESAAGERRAETEAFLQQIRRSYGISDINHIKPGVLEATRVLLRRVPQLLLLRDGDCPEAAHLKLLAAEKKVPVRIDPAMPFNATALIKAVYADT